MLATLMMLPLPRAAIFGASAATRKYGARTLAAKSRSKVATSRSAVGPNQLNPALLTKMSTEPTSFTKSPSSAGSFRSAATKRALPPSAVTASTTASPRAASRPCTTTSAPCLPNSSATALPIPEVAPVTSARMPTRSRCPFMSLPFEPERRHKPPSLPASRVGGNEGHFAVGAVFDQMSHRFWRLVERESAVVGGSDVTTGDERHDRFVGFGLLFRRCDE